MKKFSENSLIWSVRHCREFKAFKEFVINPRRLAKKIQFKKIKHLTNIYNINIPSTVDALNEMKRRGRSGQTLFYPLKRKDTGIYPFIIGGNKPFVLILPGGAFNEVCSLVEGFNTAIWLNEHGYNAFIGQYGTKEQAHYPGPQDDIKVMLDFIFAHGKEMGVDTSKYGVCGFSAGGHVAASWGTTSLGYAKYGMPKPDIIMLCYPVVTMGEGAHKNSRKRLLGEEENDRDLQDRYSIEKQVDGAYPPTFAWHCRGDRGVPISNSENLIEALKSYGVPTDFFPVDGDKHGWGLGVGTPAEGWAQRAVNFWKSL